MPGLHRVDDYDVILGKLVCDRIGLPPNDVMREGFSVDRVNPGIVMVKATVMRTIPADEMAELETIAHARYMAAHG